MSGADAADQAVPPSERMRLLEQKANVIRSRLLRAVDVLDTRRHQVVEMGAHARQMVKPVALSLLGIAALFGVGALAVGLAVAARRRRSFGGQVSHALQKLDLVAQPSLARRVFERITLSMMTVAATELAKRMTKKIVDGRLAGHRRLAGGAVRDHDERELALGSGGAR